jgi:outer membrane protein OmpA-like peptidoglycan-associated protein
MRAAALPVIFVAFAFSTTSLAQGRATQSVDDYLCAFAGKCSGTESQDQSSKEAPPTKGMRLIRPTGTTPATTAATAVDRQPMRASAGGSVPRVQPHRLPERMASARSGGSGHASSSGARAASLVGHRKDLQLSFELGSADLTAQAREEARVFAESLLRPELAGTRFLIEGHTDSMGGRTYNMHLSQRRAAAVADYLASLGVQRNRLQTRGFGYDQPLPGHPAESPENRRVEAMLTY